MAQKPYNAERIQAARRELDAIGGADLVVEAAYLAAMFELVTKLVDGTRRRPFPTALYTIADILYWLAQVVHDMLFWLLKLMNIKQS